MKKQWVYEFNLWKNPTILITVLKIMLLATAVPILLLVLLEVGNGVEAAIKAFKTVSFMLFVIFSFLTLLAYGSIAVLYGGKYCVIFIMDEKGIHHIQMKKQFEKYQVIALLNTLTGIGTGNLQVAGSGLISGSRQSQYTQFSKVKKVIVRKKRNSILLSAPFNYNQIYMNPNDFDQITDFITSHCTHAIVKKK